MKGFKTLGFNLAGAILPILEAADFTDVLGDSGMSIYAVVLTVANLFLRSITTTAIGKSK